MKITSLLFLSLLINGIFLSSAEAAAAENMLLRLELNRPKDKELDTQIYTIGAFSVTNDKVGHFDLINFRSKLEGDVWGLDFGLGYSFVSNRQLVMYAGFGFLTGYNSDQSKFIPGFYPEIGLLFTIKQGVSITATAKRYFNVYNEDTDALMIGLALSY